jgi:hypothetical protein
MELQLGRVFRSFLLGFAMSFDAIRWAVARGTQTEIRRQRSDYMGHQLTFYLLPEKQPLIQLGRCAHRGDELQQGRRYYTPWFYRGQEVVEKSPEFVAWAKKTLVFARKMLVKAPGGQWVGERTLQWVRGGGRLTAVLSSGDTPSAQR